MKTGLLSFIYFASIALSLFSIHEALADRGPSIEPFAEVDIQNNKQVIAPTKGYDFNQSNYVSNRTPAGIVPKDAKNPRTPYSFIGPIIFLMALPFAIWMVITKKISHESRPEDRLGYYPKTFQFKPFQTDYQKNDDTESDNDDIDYPRAS